MFPSHPDALLQTLAQLQARALEQGRCEVRIVHQVAVGGQRLPVPVFAWGSTRAQAPALGVFGGVHGLERIGTEVALGFLASLLHRLDWDRSLQWLGEHLRIVVMPLVNPGGLVRGTRANPAGVDLMRNAPVDCELGAPWLVGGQRLSPGLPWYRGPAGAALQPEAQALCDVVRQELGGRPLALAVDCHSGFGLRDRLWFPYAHTRRPVPHLADLWALSALLDQAQRHHRYVFEPQSRHYLAHGDLWDHLYLQSLAANGAPPDGRGPALLPLTLEMGSWLWVKKNPRQVFSRHGLFNPLIGHRRDRVMRRHQALLDFLLRAAASHDGWRPVGAARERQHAQALAHWYGRAGTAADAAASP